MSNFLDMIDKYKFGLIAALTTYVLIFVYLQMATFEEVVHYEPFHDGAHVETPEEEIELKPENIMAPANLNGEVKNISRDVNDDRPQSYSNWSANKSVADVEAEYKKLEQEMYAQSGGAKTREEIRKQFEAQKKADMDAAKNKNNTSSAPNSGDTGYKGSVMADWQLEGRTPHQNNNWYVRVPGYLCGKGSGHVMVRIKVNQNGNVIDATYSASESSGANQCMIDNAVKYAKMSRFNYGSQSVQSGYILYTFVSQ